nr:hypothetical protein RM5p1_00010 [Serratia proteamaculans]
MSEDQCGLAKSVGSVFLLCNPNDVSDMRVRGESHLISFRFCTW